MDGLRGENWKDKKVFASGVSAHSGSTYECIWAELAKVGGDGIYELKMSGLSLLCKPCVLLS